LEGGNSEIFRKEGREKSVMSLEETSGWSERWGGGGRARGGNQQERNDEGVRI